MSVESEKMREAIIVGLKSFESNQPDFTMSPAMRSDAAEHILSQPGMWASYTCDACPWPASAHKHGVCPSGSPTLGSVKAAYDILSLKIHKQHPLPPYYEAFITLGDAVANHALELLSSAETQAHEILDKIAPNCGVGMGGTCAREEAVRAMLAFQLADHPDVCEVSAQPRASGSFHYFVDNARYESTASALTGAQIKAGIANFNPAYQIALEGQQGGPDVVISNSEMVNLALSPQLYVLPPMATFG